jgi:hypothetical protein
MRNLHIINIYYMYKIFLYIVIIYILIYIKNLIYFLMKSGHDRRSGTKIPTFFHIRDMPRMENEKYDGLRLRFLIFDLARPGNAMVHR